MKKYWVTINGEIVKAPSDALDHTRLVYLAADVEEVFVPLLQRVVGLAHIEERWRAEAQRLLERLR